MRHLSDGERDIIREIEADCRPAPGECVCGLNPCQCLEVEEEDFPDDVRFMAPAPAPRVPFGWDFAG